ncbi:hypothetical protein TWF506_000269, partial [Arthrobotrys conoides]
MASLNLVEGQETPQTPTALSQKHSFIPRKYRPSYKDEVQPSQLPIPQDPTHPSYPIPQAILPSQASPSSPSYSPSYHYRPHSRQLSQSSSVTDTSNMLWDQARLSSPTFEPIFTPQMTQSHSRKSLSDQMFSMVPGVSSPFLTPLAEDIDPTITYEIGRSNSMPLFPSDSQFNIPVPPGYGSEPIEYENLLPQSMGDVSPHYFAHTAQWTSPLLQIPGENDFYGQSIIDDSVVRPGAPPSSDSVYETGTREISVMTQSYHPENQTFPEGNRPSYAEMIYMALMSVPSHQMHLQDIYQWFKDTYPKYRYQTSKGWMNSIRHNLSMNGAFVKVERPNGESGKGYMWLLAPAAVEGGIQSTTRYRKMGKAGDRVALAPNASYDCFVTPKRNRTGKRIQTKASRSSRNIRSKKLQRRQHINEQPPKQLESTSFSEFDNGSMVHTPVSTEGPPLTPDVSSRSSESFSETLSVGSRHTTPALRGTEWHAQSPASAHGHASPFYISDDGFCAPFESTSYYP